MPSARPRSVTSLALAVLTIGVLHLARFLQTLSSWNILEELLAVSPVYLSLSSLVWAGVCLVLAYGLWVGAVWAPQLMRLSLLAYLIFYWADRLLLSPRRALPDNTPFAALVSILAIGFVFWFFRQPRIKAFFGGSS